MSAMHASRRHIDDDRAASIDGTWTGTGTDREGTTWLWKLTIEQEKNKLQGTFHWTGSHGQHGIEHVRGEYAPAARTFILRGMDVEHADRVGPNTYFAYIGEDLVSIVGYWTDWEPGVFIGTKR